MGKPSKRVQKLMDAKVTPQSLQGSVGNYPGLHEKIVLELAWEIYCARSNIELYEDVLPWEDQQEAMDYFNEHGFVETLDRMMKLRVIRKGENE